MTYVLHTVDTPFCIVNFNLHFYNKSKKNEQMKKLKKVKKKEN